MNDLEYRKYMADKFQEQFNNIHKKYQRQLQAKNSNRLQIFLNKKTEILDLMWKQHNNNRHAFLYIYDDYLNYIHKLSYKINREVLKHKRSLIIASSNRFRKGKI